jgi:hypothetical protein
MKRCTQYMASAKAFSNGGRTVAIVELPWVLDLPMPAEAPVAIDAPAGLTRGILVGLGVSAPLWLGLVWLITWLAATLQID